MKIPYPLRAFSLALRFHPFTWGLHACRKPWLDERARAAGISVWWVRVGCFTLSYGRML